MAPSSSPPAGASDTPDPRIAILQTNPRLGDVRANLDDTLGRIDAALEDGAGLVVTPELSLCGYFLKDQVDELAQPSDSPLFDPIRERSHHACIAIGFVERSRSNRLYNALAFFEDGELIGVHRKVHLVSYGLFDEARDFAAGDRFRIVESKVGRLGPLICEDLWHSPSAYLHFLNDADLLVVASASPARGIEAPGPGLGSQRTWKTILGATALLYRTWIAYAGRVGWEDGIGFAGSSCVFDPFGRVTHELRGFEPGTLLATLESSVLRRARVETPLRRDEKPWILAAELERSLGRAEVTS